MANLSRRITVELENIQQVLSSIPSKESIYKFNGLELAGIAALILSFYNGIENVLKQILLSKKISIPSGERWHKDLLDLAFKHKIITKTTHTKLARYLIFRHFFTHAYAYNLDPDKLEALVNEIEKVYKSFVRGISNYICKE